MGRLSSAVVLTGIGGRIMTGRSLHDEADQLPTTYILGVLPSPRRGKPLGYVVGYANTCSEGDCLGEAIHIYFITLQHISILFSNLNFNFYKGKELSSQLPYLVKNNNNNNNNYLTIEMTISTPDVLIVPLTLPIQLLILQQYIKPRHHQCKSQTNQNIAHHYSYRPRADYN